MISLTAKYLRGKMDASEFCAEIAARTDGRRVDGVVAKIVEGMPEDKVTPKEQKKNLGTLVGCLVEQLCSFIVDTLVK